MGQHLLKLKDTSKDDVFNKVDKPYQETFVIVGLRNSGKSTIFKQLRLMYTETGLPKEDKLRFKADINRHIIRATQDILTYYASEKQQKQFRSYTGNAVRNIENVDANTFTTLTAPIAQAISTIWNDEHFRSIYENSPFFSHGLEGNAIQCANYPKWGGPEWIPTDEDILRCNIRTLGVHELLCTYHEINFRIYDFDGIAMRRAVTRGMIQSISNLVFVAALSDYDEIIPDEKDSNGLAASVSVFQACLKNRNSGGMSPVLILNKADKFREKLCKKLIPLNATGHFPDAPRTFNYEHALDWIHQMFLKEAQNERDVQVYVVNALDNRDVKSSFDNVFHQFKTI